MQSFKVEDGDTVSQGDLLAVMEAMKMETQIVAPKAGKVRLIVKEGDYLQAGAALLDIAG
ncbi:Methylmalonyl-CoA carboxyltransferase 1.3S subunit [compost metagenome]